jgi:GNAT superfamily N-acetyltransferase
MIRPATAADVPSISRLIRALAEYERLEQFLTLDDGRMRDHLFGTNPVAEVLLAEDEDKVVGYALFFPIYSTFRCRSGLYLEDLFVQPEYRGRGHGKALLVAVAQRAVKRDCGKLEWSVLNWNEPSIRFYRSMGAVPVEGWTAYRLAGEALTAAAGLPHG